MEIHFSIDDVLMSLRWCARNTPSSIFAMDFFGTLAKWHGLYGLRCNLYVFYTDDEGFDLGQLPERYRQELLRQQDWLLLSYHGIRTQGDYLDDAGRFEQEWRAVLELYPTENRPHMTRFHCWDLPRGLQPKLVARGVGGLLCPSGGSRLGYGMDEMEGAELDQSGQLKLRGLIYWRTDVRWDFLSLEECSDMYRARVMVKQDRPVVVFGHEWRFAQQKDVLEEWLAGLPAQEWIL